MKNPYKNIPDYAFWRKSMVDKQCIEYEFVTETSFSIGRNEKIATAGSCFAQHFSQFLVKEGFLYYVTEEAPLTRGSNAESYGIFPARFGNIYTVKQLLQLFQRAYGLFIPADVAWCSPNGSWIDPFRPRIQKAGFASIEDLCADRENHFRAVRQMFEECDVFIFTLGLTEAWRSKADGAVFPLAPGVSASVTAANYEFHNFDVQEMLLDLSAFLSAFRLVNKNCKILLTVSPVPLIATYERRHVLCSTVYSKSALRVVAENIKNKFENIDYFPSFEIITGPQSKSNYFAEDLREVTSEGVATVMSVFRYHYLKDNNIRPSKNIEKPLTPSSFEIDLKDRMYEAEAIVCDEEAIEEMK